MRQAPAGARFKFGRSSADYRHELVRTAMTQPVPRGAPRNPDRRLPRRPAASVGVVLQDARGRILVASDQAARLLGADGPDALTGRAELFENGSAIRPDGSEFPTDQQPAALALCTGQAQRKTTLGFRLPDGEIRWFHVRAEPLFEVGNVAPYATMSRFVPVSVPLAVERERSQGRVTPVAARVRGCASQRRWVARAACD